MFNFSRRTLWIIIYLTIPMIIILNNLGPSERSNVEISQSEHWSLDEVFVEQKGNAGWLYLEASGKVRMSVITHLLPNTTFPDEFRSLVSIHQQGGLNIITFLVPSTFEPESTYFKAIRNWIPESNRTVISGDYGEELSRTIEDLLVSADGSAVKNEFSPANGLSVLAAPKMGTDENLAFLIWIDILRQRLAGYEIQARWDHRNTISSVVFNSTLDRALFSEVTVGELSPILSAYRQLAKSRLREASQLHRYAVTAALYQLPFSFFVNQSERLDAVSLDAINRMREFSFGQTTH